MKRLLPFTLILAACPTEPVPEEPTTIVEPAEEGPNEKSIRSDILCFKVAGITEASLQGTVHYKEYDPEKFVDECNQNLEGPKAAGWKTYYECVVYAGDKSYVAKCAGVAVSPF